VIAIDMESVNTSPVFDPVSQIVYAAGRDQVSDVWIAGNQVLRDSSLARIDEGDLLGRVRGWQHRISLTDERSQDR
jgi:5-methylthioadenosine/S-adenosylhomocysteine deaminase